MMQSVLGNSSKVLVDQKSASLLYLPLDKLIQQSAQSPSTTTPDVTTPPRIPPAPDAMPLDGGRSREALRSREGR
jgi:membrane protease subunit HflK